MIAKFFAQRIIDDEVRTVFADVPELLKEQVRNVLTEEGYEHLTQVEGGK